MVGEISRSPYPAICHIRVIPGGKVSREFFATGFLVHPNLVLTTGYHVHSIYKTRDAVGPAKEVQVFINLSKGQHDGGASKFLERVVVKDSGRLRVPDEWKIDEDKEFNIGGILIDRSDPTKGEVIQLQQWDASNPSDQVCTITSYPRDVPDFPELWESKGRVVPAGKNGDRLLYSIDTGDASSGAPIWFQDAEAGPVAVGIHVSSGTVRGIPFNDKNWPIIEKWLAEAEELANQ